MNCHKVIIEDICRFNEAWAGYDAKWIDGCSKSDDATVDLLTYEIKAA